MGKTAQPGSAETLVKSRARRAAIPPVRAPAAGARAVAGAAPGAAWPLRGAAPRAWKAVAAGIYVFICLLHLKLNGGGGEGEGGITGFLNAFAVHAESYLFKPNTTQTRHKHTRTFFKKRLQMCPFKKRL